MAPSARTNGSGWFHGGMGLALVLLLSAVASAQEIVSVAPGEGTIGDLVTIQGSGFGSKKPKVELVDPLSGKKAKGSSLKVMSNDDSTLTVLVKNAKAGAFDLRVSPKGGEALLAVGAFVVQPPMILPGDPQSGEPGDTVVVDVAFLGGKKPKVSIGPVKAGVQASDDDTVAVVIPKKLANGSWPVTLTTPVGSSTSAALVTVTGSDASLGKTFIDVSVDDEAFKVSKKNVDVTANAHGVVLSLSASKQGVTRELRLQLPVDWAAGAAPASLAGLPEGGALIAYSVSDDDGSTSYGAAELSAELYAFNGGLLAGGFSAVLVADDAGDVADVSVGGTFVIGVEAPDLDPGSALLTTVTGLVVDTALKPVAGATVTTSAEAMPVVLSDADGSFAFSGHPSQPSPLVVHATLGELSGFALLDALQAGGVSPAGVLVLDVDSDDDGLPDWYETNVSGSDPLLPDSDLDDFNDDLELLLGLDPNTPDASTTISAQVTLPDPAPAVGASVRVQGAPTGYFEGSTNGSGAVTLSPDWPAALSPVVLEASLDVPGEGLLSGTSLPTATVPGGMTVVPSFALGGSVLASGAVLYPGAKVFGGSSARAFVVDDFDGDGRADLAACGSNDFVENLWVLLGQGDGTFELGHTSFLGDAVTDLALGDLDGDGVSDLVTANGFFDEVSVTLGQGAGVFGSFSDFDVGQGPEVVALAELSADGQADVVTLNADDETVSVLLGDGTGQLAAAVDYPVDADPQDLAVADLDGDGARDLIVANAGSASLSLLFGLGDGSFDPAVSVAVGDEPQAVAVGDFDEDGRLDLVTANDSSADATVLLNLGAGLFAEPVSFPMGNQFSTKLGDVTVGDLDLDGHLDLVLASQLNDELLVTLGDGLGGFAAPVVYGTGAFPDQVEIADLNGDGSPELLSLSALGQDVTVLIAAGGGLFDSRSQLAGDDGGPNGVLSSEALDAGDLDGDGDVDLVGALYFFASDDVHVLTNDGAGTYQHGLSYPESLSVRDVILGDLDGDGALDVVSARHATDELSVRLGGGDASFGAADVYAVGNGPAELALADLNDDGDLDLISADINDDQVSVLLGQGNGGFGAASSFAAGDGPRSLAVADLDGDGALDLALADQLSDQLALLFGVGDGSFVAPQFLAAGDTPWAVDVGDLDADGDVDLVLANQDSGDLSLWFGDGLGGFDAAEPLPTGEDPGLFASSDWPRDVVVADLDGDDLLDLAVANYLGAELGVFLGQGGGAFATVRRHATGSGLKRLVVADLDGDGQPDLANTSEGDAVWFLLNVAPDLP